MKDTHKRILGWAAFSFLVMHCLAIFLFAFPYKLPSDRLNTAVNNYVSPIFEQTWSLFAPAPIHESKLRVKYIYENDSTDWIQPLKEDIDWHHTLRCSHHGEIALAESNLLYYVANDIQTMGLSLYEPFPIDSTSSYLTYGSYWIARQFVYGVSKYRFEKHPLKAQVECRYTNVKTGEKGIILLPEFDYSEK